MENYLQNKEKFSKMQRMNFTQEDFDNMYEDENSYGGYIPNQKKSKEKDGIKQKDKIKQDRNKLREAKRAWEEAE